MTKMEILSTLLQHHKREKENRTFVKKETNMNVKGKATPSTKILKKGNTC